MASALKHTAGLLEDDSEEQPAKVDSKAHTFGTRLKDAMAVIWDDKEGDVFDARSGLFFSAEDTMLTYREVIHKRRRYMFTSYRKILAVFRY